MKRFQAKNRVKKGDNVIVVAGAYKDLNTPRKVVQVFPIKNRVLVENVNMVKKHMKPTNENGGGIVETNAPIHLSNVMLADPKTGEPTRIGFRQEDGKSVRYSKKSGETIK